MSKKARNGAGTVERRGALWWIQVSMPPGHIPRRPRLPILESEGMTESQAKRAGAKLAADVRAGKIVFDPNLTPPRSAPLGYGHPDRAPVGASVDERRTDQENTERSGLRPMSGGYIMVATLGMRATALRREDPTARTSVSCP
jgi:hypothetical protein